MEAYSTPYENIWTNVTESCLTIPYYRINQAQASEIFNNVFNYATKQVVRELNSNSLVPTSYAISARIKKIVEIELKNVNPKAIWNTGKCSGDVPETEAEWCP